MSRSLLCGALALMFAVSACTTFRSSERLPAAAASTYVHPRYAEFQQLMAASLDFRSRAMKFAFEKDILTLEELKELEAKKIPLPGLKEMIAKREADRRAGKKEAEAKLTREEVNRVHSAALQYVKLRKQLFEVALEGGSHFGADKTVQLTPGKGTTLNKIKKPYIGGARGMPDKILEVWNIDPTDRAGQEAIFSIQMSLAASLILMDNYLVAIQPYQDNASMRYYLNYDLDFNKDIDLIDISDSFTNPARRAQIQAGIDFTDAVMKFRREKMVDTNEQETSLYTVAQTSIWYMMAKNGEIDGSVVARIKNLWDRATVHGKRGSRIITYGLSMGFGNVVGLYEERKGLLYNMPQAERDGLISEMKPLDILFEKTPFRLTDKFIPGHFGHVAIFLGTEEQLKDLRVWDQIPRDVQTRVRSGHYIVEALRPGVQINSIDHFLNIDDFMVIRDTRSNITDDYRRQAVLTSVAQLGKEYDFNFDVTTTTRIVCSEIAYVVYPDIVWPTTTTLKRNTISPDNVAVMAQGPQRIFEPTIIYHNGKRITKDLNRTLDLLLEATDASYAEVEKSQN
jgi:hypothetical protein